MGLLDRASKSQTENNGTDLISRLGLLEKGVDFPVVLFRTVSEHFNVEKGALFFRDSDSSYSCLSSKGYDKTTANRLRLESVSLEYPELLKIKKTRRSSCFEGALPLLKSYMSTREFGLLEKIYWLPFFRNDELFSLIMITQWKGIEPDEWDSVFDNISLSLSEPLYNSRKSLVSDSKTNRKSSREQEFKEILTSRADTELILVEVKHDSLTDKLMELREGLSILNLKDEILRVFKTLAGPGQDALDIGNNRIILILDRNRVPDLSLFIHQITASLPLLFQDLPSAPDLETVEYESPAGSDEIDLFTGKLFRNDS